MPVSQSQTEKIERAIRAFAADPEPFVLNFEAPVNLRLLAGELNFLPVSLNFCDCYGVRPDGQVVLLDVESDLAQLEVEKNPGVCRWVLCQAAKKYPELQELMPIRPVEAADCPDCNGTGINQINIKYVFAEERIVCGCGGLGWLPKDEKQSF